MAPADVFRAGFFAISIFKLLGHSTIQMTMRYAHLGPEVTRDAVNLLDKPVNGNVAMARPVVTASAG